MRSSDPLAAVAEPCSGLGVFLHLMEPAMTGALEKNNLEAANIVDAEAGQRPLAKLADKMGVFPRDTDAWQDFLAAIDHILEFHPDGLAMNISVTPAIWDYWSLVSAHACGDYDSAGVRTKQKTEKS
jgi:hypothetical protein